MTETEKRLAVVELTVKSMRKQLNHFNDRFSDNPRLYTILVRCPNWQCSGNLLTFLEPHFDGDKREDGWQMPSFKCNDCGTIWRNGMLGDDRVHTNTRKP